METKTKKMLNENDFRIFLDKLVMGRFKDIEELKNKIKDIFKGYSVEIEKKSEIPEDEIIGDYCFIGAITGKGIYFDFDIWYLIDRQKQIYITETTGEFQ